MRVTQAVILALAVSSSAAFSIQKGATKQTSSTQLFKFRPTKWTPQGGATGSATSGASMADVARSWESANTIAPADHFTPISAPEESFAAPPVAAPVTSGGELKHDYTGMRWSPETGARPMSLGPLDGSMDAASASSYEAPPVSVEAPPAAAPVSLSSAPKKDYTGMRWSPETGARPMSLGPLDVVESSSMASAPATSYEAPPAASSSAAPPKKDYTGMRWSPQTGARPMSLGPLDAIESTSSMESAPVVSYEEPPAATSLSAPPKKDYTGMRWSPQTGARPMSLGPLDAVESSSTMEAAPAASYEEPPAATSLSAPPKKDYTGMRWSPQTGARPMSLGPLDAIESSSTMDAAPAASYEEPPASYEEPAVSAASTSISSAPKKDYTGMRWSPQTGARPMSLGPLDTVESSSMESAPAASYEEPPVEAVSSSAAPPKKDYTGMRWSPQTGARPMSLGPLDTVESSSMESAPAASYEEPPLEASVSSSAAPPKKDYTGMRWSPQTGARPMSLGPLDTADSSSMASAPAASYEAPPAEAPVSSSAAPPKKDYTGMRWSPQTGARPMSLGPLDAIDDSSMASAPATSYEAPPSESPVSLSAAPKKDYTGMRWSPQTGARPMSLGPLDAIDSSSMESAPATSYEAPPAEASAGLSAPPKKDFTGMRWSPQTGARPMSLGPLDAVDSSSMASAPAASYEAPPTSAPVSLSAPPKKDFTGMRWSPQTGARPMSLGPLDGTASSMEAAPAALYEAPPVEAAYEAPPAATQVASAVAPKKDFTGMRWSPQTGARPMSLDVASASSMAAASPAAPVAGPATDDLASQWASANADQDGSLPPPKMATPSYSVSKWDPKSDTAPAEWRPSGAAANAAAAGSF